MNNRDITSFEWNVETSPITLLVWSKPDKQMMTRRNNDRGEGVTSVPPKQDPILRVTVPNLHPVSSPEGHILKLQNRQTCDIVN